MANFHRPIAINDVDQAIAGLNRARKVKLVLALAVIIGTAIAALVFAQLSSSVP